MIPPAHENLLDAFAKECYRMGVNCNGQAFCRMCRRWTDQARFRDPFGWGECFPGTDECVGWNGGWSRQDTALMRSTV